MNVSCNVGDSVFFMDGTSQAIIKGTVIGLSGDYAKISWGAYVTPTGDVINSAYGCCFVPTISLHSSPKECVTDYHNRTNRQIGCYRKNITSVRDLLLFPLSHPFWDDNGTPDECAVIAYKQRAQELTGEKL